jgi:hypothetical protein
LEIISIAGMKLEYSLQVWRNKLEREGGSLYTYGNRHRTG